MRILFRLLSLPFLIGVAPLGHATSVSTTSAVSAVPESTQSLSLPTQGTSAVQSWQGFSAQMRLESMQYLRETDDAADLTRSQFLSGRASLQGQSRTWSWLRWSADASAGTFFRRSQTQFVVHEANLQWQSRSKLNVALGRKRSFWSAMDQTWNLGLWQPQFAIDALRPEQQGLTGLFVDGEIDRLHLTGFATAVFIPTMGPDIREESGRLISDSRWYRRPSEAISINNRVQSIAYELDIPAISKLAFQPASGAHATWGSRDLGGWMAGGWAYKPVNDLILQRRNFSSIPNDRVDVTVSPAVTYHDVVSLDAGYSTDFIRATVSMIQDRPRETAADPDFSIQRLDPIEAYSAQVDWTFPRLTRAVQVQVAYLKIRGGGITDVTADGQPDDFTLFDSRMKFSDAVSIALQGQLGRIARRPLLTRFRYLYDRDQRGSLMNTEFQVYPQREWALIVGADILGVDDETYRPSGFLNQFRANDRVYGGMTYVF